MKVIIPAAGQGSRLRPHTYTKPKPLIELAGKPILGHILDEVIACGGDRITLIVGHLRQQIESYVYENYDINVEFREQEQQLGLGHAILTGLDEDDDEILVILGDTIFDTNLNDVISRGITSIGVKEVEDPRKFGVVVLEDGRVKKLVEKPQDPPSNLAIVGVYYISDGARLAKAINEIITRNITVKGEYQVTDAFQILIDWDEEIQTFPVEGWYDCGRPETLIETNRYLFSKYGSHIGSIDLQDSAVIDPVHIADDVQITKSVIGPNVSIGNGTVVNNSIISDSLISESCVLENVIISDSIMGENAHIKGDIRTFNISRSSRIDSAS